MKKLGQKEIKTLQDLGLSDIQIKLYLTSLEKGVLSVLELSKITKINRQQIYDQAEKLVEFGLYDITRKQGRKYIPASPEKLVELSKKKIANLEKISDKLLDITAILNEIKLNKKDKIVTKHYEGLEKIKDAYAQELVYSKNTEVLSLAGLIDEIFEYFPQEFWDKWNREFAKHNSRARMLVQHSEIAMQFAKHDKEYKLETRYLNNFPLNVNIDVFDNVVLIVSYVDELAIWIESSVVSQSYRILFELLWEQAKKFEAQ